MEDDVPRLRSLVDSGELVRDEEILIRVIQPAFQDESGSVRSNGYQDQDLDEAARWGLDGHCASVAIRSIWLQASGDVQDLLRDFADGSILVQFTARDVRSLKTPGGAEAPQGVMLDPRDGRPWHAVIFNRSGGRRSTGGKRGLGQIATPFP